MPQDGGDDRRSTAPSGLPTRRARPALRPYVTRLTAYDMTGVDLVHHGVPSPDLTVILTHGRPVTVGWSADPARSGDFRGLVSGLHDAPAFVFPADGHAGTQLAVTPLGARALFGLPAAALAAGLVDLQDIWGTAASDLLDGLDRAPGWTARLDLIEDALATRLTARPVAGHAIRPELAWAWHRIVHGGVGETGRLADEIGWSRGYFARLFAAEYGLRPKETARVARFTRARTAAAHPGIGLAQLAATHGYADQAHLTREWRRLAGCTPTGWRSELSAFVQDGGVPAAAV